MRRMLQKLTQNRNYDFPQIIEKVSYMLKALCINIDSRDTKRVPTAIIALLLAMGICNIYTFMVSTVWFVFWRCPQIACDLVTDVVNFSLGLASTTGCAKLVFIILYQDTVKGIIDGYISCDALVEPGTRFSNNVRKTLMDVKKRILFLWTVVLGNCFSFILIKPLIVPGKHLLDDKQVLMGLEPMFESPNFELALAIVGVGVVYVNYICISTCTLFMAMTGYTEAQMVALGIELTSLWDDALDHYVDEAKKVGYKARISTVEAKNKIMNQYVHVHLIDLIKRHTMYVSLMRRVENVFRGALATEFVMLIIGLISQLLGGLENTYLLVPFTFIQAAIDCWTGQLLINTSDMFENSIYDCKWENFDGRNMKIVLLMLMNSQKPLKLSAGGIATLNFSCLMSIIKSIFSTYTALRSTMHN